MPMRCETPHPSCRLATRYLKNPAVRRRRTGNVLPCGSASRDCKEFYQFFDSLANPVATRLSSTLNSDRRELIEVKLREMRSLLQFKKNKR